MKAATKRAAQRNISIKTQVTQNTCPSGLEAHHFNCMIEYFVDRGEHRSLTGGLLVASLSFSDGKDTKYCCGQALEVSQHFGVQ